MSKLRERIAANRSARQRSVTEVPEWGEGDEPMRVYSGQVTGQDMDKISRKHPDFLRNPSMEAQVDMIILKAEDENGEKCFTLEDKMVMLGEPASLISTVFASVFSASTVEEQEKN
jgi:hypothetical protein